jgi:hypothetical protein
MDPLAESDFKIKAGEIYDTASSFHVVLVGATYPASTGGAAGSFFTFTPSGNSNDARIRFYDDANHDNDWDLGEVCIVSPQFKVKPLNVLNFTYDISAALVPGEFPAGNQAFQYQARIAKVRDAVSAGVKRLRMRNSEDDFRAAVNIIFTPHVYFLSGTEIFTPVSPSHDPIREGTTDQNDNFNEMQGNSISIRFITGWVNTSGVSTGQRGLTDNVGNRAIVSWLDMGVTTIVHEIGHILFGPGHNDSDTMNIMHTGPKESADLGIPGPDPNQNKLSLNEANKYSGV